MTAIYQANSSAGAAVLSGAVRLVGPFWRGSRLLTAVGLVMLAAVVPTAVGVFVDPRIITGAPAWLKPFKFAISTAIYSLTLAWIFGLIPGWPRMRRIVAWTTAVVFVLENTIIFGQAARGTTSHFNSATPLDRALFIVMGSAILIQTFVSVAVAVALWRTKLADRSLGWALRFGMTLTIAGAMTGPLMTRPTTEQLAQARAGGPMSIIGAHSVGGVDGGPGVPVTGWSREHGDVRVPHFIGLHAIQALAIVALLMGRSRRSGSARVRVVLVAAASYTTLFLLLLWQALRGQSIVAPDTVVLAALVAWAALSALAVGAVFVRSRTTNGVSP